jgi:hypothetical protein
MDFFTTLTGAFANTPLLANSIGVLSPAGAAHTVLTVPGGLPPSLAGLRLDFSCVVADPATLLLRLASTPAGVTLLP